VLPLPKEGAHGGWQGEEEPSDLGCLWVGDSGGDGPAIW
jgi:hypothetical protein